MSLLWVDWVILGIIGVSALISLFRGFVREALSLAGWIAAFLVARGFYEAFAVLLESHIPTTSIRLAVAWAILFVITLLLAGLVNYLAGRMIAKAGMSGTDRMLGMIFGAARGVLVVALLVLGLRQFTPVPQDDWWQESSLLPHMEIISDWFYDQIYQVLPDRMPEQPVNSSSQS